MLNRSCDCTLTDMPALQRRLDLDAATHPHLFSAAPVFLDPEHAGEMQRIVAAIEGVIELPAYQQRVLQGAPRNRARSQECCRRVHGLRFPSIARRAEVDRDQHQRRGCVPERRGARSAPVLLQCRRQLSRSASDGAAARRRAVSPCSSGNGWRHVANNRLRSIAIVDENPTGAVSVSGIPASPGALRRTWHRQSHRRSRRPGDSRRTVCWRAVSQWTWSTTGSRISTWRTRATMRCARPTSMISPS